MADFKQTSELIQTVRKYTKRHEKLAKAHHFSFDLPFHKNVTQPDYIVMGVNPGHSKKDHGPDTCGNEESREFDFHLENGRSPASKGWRSKTKKFVGTENVVFAEIFFWSAANSIELVKHFGTLDDKNKYLKFCTKLNKQLFQIYDPSAIICPGLSNLPLLMLLYELKLTKIIYKKESQPMMYRCVDAYGRHWIFLKHWSGARWKQGEAERVRRELKTLLKEAKRKLRHTRST